MIFTGPTMMGSRGLPRLLRSASIASAVVLAVALLLPRLEKVAPKVGDWLAKRTADEADLELVQKATLPFATFLCLVTAAVVGAFLGGVVARFARDRRVAIATAVALTTAAVIASAHIEGWLGKAVLVALPVLVGVVGGPSGWKRETSMTSQFVLGAEGGALALGMLFPYSEHHGGLVGLGCAVGFAIAAVLAGRLSIEKRLDFAALALPLLVLPLSGLARNPTLKPALYAAALVFALAVAARRQPDLLAPLRSFVESHGAWLALCSICLPLVLPYGFRDIDSADWKGHEAQHLGWINSITHGRWMMADAGFVYGPLREYTLALVARAYGRIDLAHVRLAHVTMNVVGLGALLYATRRFVGARLGLLAFTAALLVVHSALTAFVVYTTTYSFGWADATRSGAALVALALACTARTRRARIVAGALGGLSALYSHDFGVFAIATGALGTFASVAHVRGGRFVDRLEAAAVETGVFMFAAGGVLVLFAIPYVVTGRGRALVAGFRWSARVALGTQAFTQEPYPIDGTMIAEPMRLLEPIEPEGHLGVTRLDYLVVPLMPALGLVHSVGAIASGTFRRRTVSILALSTFALLIQRHLLLSADGWHNANAAGPTCVLVVLLVRESAGAAWAMGRTVVRWGRFAVTAAVLSWVFNGQLAPLEERFHRLASGEEHPSFGPEYHYDLPRAGDVRVGPEHVDPALWVRRETQPTDPVFGMTWLLGGGVEAFLSDRRNPTPFDTPQECVSEPMKLQLLHNLERDPPVIILGDFFDQFGPEVRAYVDAHWDRAAVPFAVVVRRRKP